MKHYEEKHYYLYEHQNWKCPVCDKFIAIASIYPGQYPGSLHHKMRKHKGNRKNYPLLIDSIINLQLIHKDCHIDHHGSCGKMTDLEAERYEEFLRRHPAIARWCNNPVGKLWEGK